MFCDGMVLQPLASPPIRQIPLGAMLFMSGLALAVTMMHESKPMEAQAKHRSSNLNTDSDPTYTFQVTLKRCPCTGLGSTWAQSSEL